MNKYKVLFEPAKIGNLTLKNRLIMAPMGAGSDMNAAIEVAVPSYSGTISDNGIRYYEERAKGGAGMIIVGHQGVTSKTDPWMKNLYGLDTDLQTISWSKLSEHVKAYGAALCVQLACGLGRNAKILPGMKNVAPSELPCFFDSTENTRSLTIEEIHEIVAAFGRAASRAKKAGVDAIEIHAHIGYLLDQFMTPLWNKRSDEYGGSFENRMRFPTEIYHAIRENVGPGYPIIFRMVMDHKIEGGRTPEESAEIIRYLDEIGVDAFDIDAGCYEAYQWGFPTASMGDAPMAGEAAMAKRATDKPVLNAGSYTPDSALDAVKSGKTDFVMLGRGLLADPDFPNKLKSGTPEYIRPCIRCNEYCLSRRAFKNQSCAVNVQCLAEQENKIVKTDNPRKVAVVGGGPAGMEAARVAALKGHKVTLYDKFDKLGGQLLAAGALEFKRQIRAFVDYERIQLKKLGVNLVLNKELIPESPELKEADNIIFALGASSLRLPIPGTDGPNVYDVIEMHMRGLIPKGQKIVIAGGGASGCDCAVELARMGKDVTIVERLDTLNSKANMVEQYSLSQNLKETGIKVLLGHTVSRITTSSVVLSVGNETKEIEADNVVLAFGTRANQDSCLKFMEKFPDAVAIGDCVSVGQIGEAVHSGFFAAQALV